MKTQKAKKYRKFPLYKDYLTNVVDKCSHGMVILDHKKFRDYRFAAQFNKNLRLPAGKLIKVVPARCKSYSCPICGKKKVLDLMDLLKTVDLKNYRFFTLTLKNLYSTDDTEKNIKRISDCFNKLNKQLRKQKQFSNLEYFRVVEIGKNGMVHIHGLWNKFIDQTYLSKLWLSITKDSYRVKVERIKSKGDAVNYLFKYLTKLSNIKDPDFVDQRLFDKEIFQIENSEQLFYENGRRRWAVSRNFFSKQAKQAVKDKKKDWLPYYFEEVNSREVEVCIESLKRQYNLSLEQFDLSRYFESDLFILDLFKNDIKDKKPPG